MDHGTQMKKQDTDLNPVGDSLSKLVELHNLCILDVDERR